MVGGYCPDQDNLSTSTVSAMFHQYNKTFPFFTVICMIKEFPWKVEFQDIKIIGNDTWGGGVFRAG